MYTRAELYKLLVGDLSNHSLIRLTALTLEKQVGCFNHRVVTLVADKLERQWLCFGVED